ncbi:hypothetical protein [Sphingomonas sp. URHD0057]|uniref:hypothetical protein n=1 Tax=Sphingomonas sp. URHD0057 TaxID=1380389 RepID=UPI00048BE501|nr:hypothetical protein [Sphingomonas sp. URHD0057]
MGRSPLDIKNMALAEVPSTRIETEGEASIEGQETLAAYQPALEYLLEDFDWGFAIRRQTLATLLTNDRTAEWQYAYALPEDMARPRFVLPFGADLANSGVPSYPAWGPWRGFEGMVPFRISGSTIYTTQQFAILEYISNAPEPSTFSARFARALALEIASRIVTPIKKDRARQGDLIKMAEAARERAKADEMNRDPESPRDFVSESQLVRAGILPWA